jgi:aldehyde:ferredoxin oxidoreductase
MVTDMAEIAYLNDLCDRLGLDTITTGNLCAFVMEAAAQGRLDYKIEYGDVDGIAALIQNIATGMESVKSWLRALFRLLGTGVWKTWPYM